MAATRALQGHPTRALAAHDGNAIPTRTEVAAGCPVGEVERLVLARVDGRRTISDIAGLLGLTTHEGVMVLTRLAELGAIALSKPSAEVDDGWDAPSGTVPTLRPPKIRADDE